MVVLGGLLKNALRDEEARTPLLGDMPVVGNMFRHHREIAAKREEPGTVSDLLMETADFYEREVDHAIDRLSAAIEPILTVVIGGLVLVMAMGLFLAMWDLASAAPHRAENETVNPLTDTQEADIY